MLNDQIDSLVRPHCQPNFGWIPKITFDELVAEMVREDLKAAERDELVKKHGYTVLNCHE
jgi:hypothetical protein